MPKRPRRAPDIQEFSSRRSKRREEFRNCSAPNCPNIVSVENLPVSYSGPIFCVLHRDRYVKT